MRLTLLGVLVIQLLFFGFFWLGYKYGRRVQKWKNNQGKNK